MQKCDQRSVRTREPAISKDADYSYWYARDVIKERFELGEKAISKDKQCSQKYQNFLDSLKQRDN